MTAVTRADIERTVWRLSGWRVEQRSVDTLLDLVDRYVGQGQAAGSVVKTAVRPPARLDPLPAATTPGCPSRTPGLCKECRCGGEPVETERQCRACLQTHPIAHFRINSKKNKRKPSTRRWQCMTCEATAREERRKKAAA